MTKDHRLGDLNNRGLLSHSSGGWKSEIKVLAGLIPPEASFFVLLMAVFSLCFYIIFPLYLSVS